MKHQGIHLFLFFQKKANKILECANIENILTLKTDNSFSKTAILKIDLKK